MQALRGSIDEARTFLKAGSLGVAENILQFLIQRDPRDREALGTLAGIARAMGDPWWRDEYERRAAGGNPASGRVPVLPRQKGPERYLLIKAWGFGFCSDLDHTLGGLLLAELSGRIPIVHWGRNSLFSTDPEKDAFSLYFEPVSPYTIDDVLGRGHDFFPPKWSDANLRQENVNRGSGDWSLLPPFVFLNRPERTAVVDMFASVVDLVRWLRPDHPMFGRSITEVYRSLVARYLRPVREIQGEIDGFAAAHMAQGSTIGAHIRGSDKHREDPELANKIAAYPELISRLSAGLWFPRVFLLTDSEPVRDDFARRYGQSLITTPSIRTSTLDGVHYQQHADRRRLGIEVLTDICLAARCDAFVGIGSSNVSCMVYHMKAWSPERHIILGPLMTNASNPFRYMTAEQRSRYVPPSRS